MADTQRTRAALLALYADNVTGQISPQDLRDGFVTIMNDEFLYEKDFWKQPDPHYLTKSGNVWKGWADYSQVIDTSAISAYHVLALMPSGGWAPADAALSTRCGLVLGLAVSDYPVNADSAIILRRGIYWTASYSIVSLMLGRPIYLASGAGSNGSWSYTITTNSTRIIGCFEAGVRLSYTSGLSSLIPVLRFEPEWAVRGI